jgi:hypothetical protein
VTPKPGDIGIVKIKGNAGKLIRIGQWLNGDGYADYEHAYVLTDDHYIVEAQPGGAVHVKQRHSWTETRWLTCPPGLGEAVAAAAVALVGTPYSALDYLAIAAHRLHIPSRRLRRYVTSTKHMICSQLADEAAKRGGWHLFDDGRLPQDVTPGDLEQLWEKQR